MTVSGLWRLLKRRGLVRDVSGAEARDLLEGKKIAIDVSGWAVQGDALESALASRSVATRCQHFLLSSFWRATRFQRIGAFPLAVVEGRCPTTKRRRRSPDGEFQRNVDLVAKLFAAMGCPVVRATNEVEECCAKLSRAGVVDAIESPDGDVLPFGAAGQLLKAVESDGGGNWSIEVLDIQQASESLGLRQQSWVALAALAGCDFLPSGAKGVGIEKGLQCVRGMLRHCSEASLKEFLLNAIDGGLPADLQKLALLSGCSTCRRCGHGAVGKQRHGTLGCEACGTTKAQGGNGGCHRRPGACPCNYHQRYDEVVFARAGAPPGRCHRAPRCDRFGESTTEPHWVT